MKNMPKNSFSWEIKKEIINNISKKQEILTFVKGFLFCAPLDSESAYFYVQIKNPYIYEKFVRKLELAGINYKIKPKAKTILFVDSAEIDFDWNLNYNDYLTYFFAGLFCARGSISAKESTSYHLELKTNYLPHSEAVLNKLNNYDFNFSLSQRNDSYLIYIKNKDKIIEFLSAIGAKESWYKFQNIIIQRDFENMTNRINNIDIGNIEKIAISTMKYIENIQYVFDNDLADKFSDQQMLLFEIKDRNRWMSFPELCEELAKHDILITKSGLNHWFRKLNKVVLDHQNKKQI
ncbi:DNA-binding protein WhiA [Mycoplasma nasistruthionis]|uniref:DNA-binding protein WhiA n=1 Tax=Mycoplasma nasistruthionis TaxID=353852 RepID=A0A4Y6I606_9MOLU|nr:DNA-binding protein WhiA [Mycoplasma nasistruthionis]QDF65065.1 DNA-binding protein WhiA [Mycoplasma nasistruthionis]